MTLCAGRLPRRKEGVEEKVWYPLLVYLHQVGR